MYSTQKDITKCQIQFLPRRRRIWIHVIQIQAVLLILLLDQIKDTGHYLSIYGVEGDIHCLPCCSKDTS